MKIVRSYPHLHPDLLRDRNRVDDDHYIRQYITDYDHRPLAQWRDNLILLEWDIAVSKEDLEAFAETAAMNPDRIIVAPYRVYWPNSNGVEVSEWVHRIITNPVTMSFRWVQAGDWECDLFGLGMTYLPGKLIQRYVDECETFQPHDPRLTDSNFSMWHYRTVKEKVPIMWHLHPVHLHYQFPRELKPGIRLDKKTTPGIGVR